MHHHSLGTRFDVRESWAFHDGDRNLQPGDVVELVVSRIGRWMHRIATEEAPTPTPPG